MVIPTEEPSTEDRRFANLLLIRVDVTRLLLHLLPSLVTRTWWSIPFLSSRFDSFDSLPETEGRARPLITLLTRTEELGSTFNTLQTTLSIPVLDGGLLRGLGYIPLYSITNGTILTLATPN